MAEAKTTSQDKQKPVVLKDGDSLCTVDNQLKDVPLSGDYYYMSGTVDGVLKAFDKNLRDLIPEEVRATQYPIPTTYKNIIIEEMIPLFLDMAKKLLPKTNDSKMGEAVTHAQAGAFHILHRLIHILRGSGDAQAVLKLLSALTRSEALDAKGEMTVELADLPWDDVNAALGSTGKSLAAHFDDKPEQAEQKTRLSVLRKRMNSVESVAFEADNRSMAQTLRESVTTQNQFLFDAFLKTLSEQPFLRSLTSPLVRNRAVYAVLSRVHKGVTEKEEQFTTMQNATLQNLGQTLTTLKTEQQFNDWYKEFVK